MHRWGKLGDCACPGKGSERPEKTFSLHIWLILRPYNQTLKRAKKITSPGKENLTPRVTSLLEFKCPVQEKNHKAYKEIGKYSAFKEKKLTEIIAEKDLIPD